MPKKLILWGIVAVVLIAGIVLGRRFVGSSEAERPAAAKRDSSPLPVYTHRAEAAPLQETVIATGSLRADEAIDLVSELSAKIVSLRIDEGSVVAAGDVLVKLDDCELQAELEQIRRRLDLARTQADRQRELFAAKGTSQETLDTAVNEVRVLEAGASLIEARLDKTSLRAPFDGVVGLRYVSEGAYVTPQSRIASLQKIDRLKIDFTIAERYMGRVTVGTPVEITVAGRDTPLTGEIYAIEPRIDPDSRTLRLRAAAANPDGRLLPGAFATVSVPMETIPDALLVPAHAVVPGLNETSLFVIEDGVARSRSVKLGLRLERQVQIISGLEDGDVVITSGQMQLRDGARVTPVEREAEANDSANTSPRS